MSASRPDFTPDQLKIGGNHLLYEVAMLCNTAALLEDEDRWQWGWQTKTLYMAVLESFLLHARSLMTFLCPAQSTRDSELGQREYFAEDYCPKPWRAKGWKGLGQERENISKDLMHLSIDRLEVGRNWPYARLLRDLRDRLLDFLDHADHRLSDHLKSEIRAVLDGQRTATADTSGSSGAYTVSLGLPGTGTPTTSMISPDRIVPTATRATGPGDPEG
jgi:hypothetical protein